MKKIFFSPSTLGFYDDQINEKMPEDVMEITAEKYEGLMTGQSSGEQISINEIGEPILLNLHQKDAM